MTFKRASFISPASSARLAVASGVSSSHAHCGERAKSAPARRRALWLAAAGVWASAGRQLRAAAVGVCALLLLDVSVPAYAQSVSFAGVQTTVPASGLLYPEGVAVDAAGDVFIADYGSGLVVEIPAGGGPQTTVGSGLGYPAGVAVDRAGNVFVTELSLYQVVELPAGGGAPITVPATGLYEPAGVAVDGADNVFIADCGNSRVVEVPAGGGAQTTVGTGLVDPRGVAVDGAGDVFVSEFSPYPQVVEVLAGGGSQLIVPASGLNEPYGVAVDGAGNVFITDFSNSRVVEVPAGGGAQITVPASGLFAPEGVAVDAAGDVFIADTFNDRVVEVERGAVNFWSVNVSSSSTATLNYSVNADTTFGSTVNVLTQGAPNLDFTLSGTTCTGTITAGNTCTVNVQFAPLAPGVRMGAVQLTDSSGNLLVNTFVHGIGQGPAMAFGPGVQTTVPASDLYSPYGVAVDGAGDVFIADSGNYRVLEVPAGGGAQTTVASGLHYPLGVAVDGAGDVFTTDSHNNRVVEVPAGGGPQTTVPASGLNYPVGVAVDGAGDVFIGDSGNNRVVEVPAGCTSAACQTTVGSGLSDPGGVAVDGAGDVFIADYGNHRVVEVPAGCTSAACQTTVGTGLQWPSGVAVDGAGDVFIADEGLNQVVEVPAGGGAQTTVGSGPISPSGLAVDGAGDVFITDGNGRVVEVQRSQAPTFSFASTLVGNTSADSPQSVTVQNIGNQLLGAVAPGLSIGSNSFVQVAGPGVPADCTSSFSLAPGASCNLSVSFIPQTTGSIVSAATFTDDALNATAANQSVTLQGTGVAMGTGQATPTVSFTGAPATAGYNSSFTVSATTNASTVAVVSASGACAVTSSSGTSSTITMTSGTGTCSLVANWAADSNYLAVSATQSTTAMQIAPTVAFTGAPSMAGDNSSFVVSATTNASSVAVITASGACAVTSSTGTSSTITMTSTTGTCSLLANWAADSNYLAASATQSTTATAIAPTVAFAGAQTTVGSGLNDPSGVAVDGAGDVFITEPTNNQVVEVQRVAVNFGGVNVSSSSTLTLNYTVNADTTFGATPTVVTQGAPSLDFTLSSTTCTGTVTEGNSCTVNVTFAPLAPGLRMGAVQLTDNSGNLLVTTMIHGIGQGPAMAFGPGVQTTVGTSLSNPNGVAVDAAGDVFIADYFNTRVVEVPAGGGAQTTVGSGLNLPHGVAVDGAGDVFIADTYNSRVVEVPAGGGAQIRVDSELYFPYGMAVDGAGDVFIADSGNDRVVEVPAGGGAPTTVPVSGLIVPYGVAVDGAGDVFIADSLYSRVVEVPAGGGVQTTVGSGLNGPQGVAVDGAGDVFIADTDNNRVVEVQRSLPPTFSFATTGVGSTSTDSPQSVTVQNIGNQLLGAVSPGLSIGSNSFVQVAGSGSPADCSSSFSLAPGASCNLSVSFTPQTTGSIVSAATFTDNALNATAASQSVTLQGTGKALATPTVSFTGAPATAGYNSSFVVSATTNASTVAVITASGACTVTSSSGTSSTITMSSGTGTCSLVANWAADSNYVAASASQSTTATKIAPAITFTGAPATAGDKTSFIVSATTNASTVAVVSASGACAVTSSSGASSTITMTSTTGTCSLAANWAADNNYLAASATQSTAVTKIAPTVAFTGAPATAPYHGTFTVAATTNASTTAVITASGSCSLSGTTVTISAPSGTCSLSASWAADNNYLAASALQSTTATKATPAITWPTPAAITYGTKLSAAQLDATATYNGAAVAGKFVYSPATGVVLTAGSQTLSATFTPTNTTDYTSASASVTLQVNPATPKITWAKPAAITYGTALSGTQLDASASVAGAFAYSPAAGTVLTAGTQTLSVTFTPSNTTDYKTATDSVTVTVNKATSTTVINSSTPNPSLLGQAVTVDFSVTGTGVPTGTVTVKASSGQTCSGTLSAGTGSCSLTFTASGSPTLTASYGGDSNFKSSTSTKVTQQVTKFTISASPASKSIAPGSSATYTITLTPVNGFTGAVGLACSGEPSGSTCTISPNSLTLSGSALTATATVTTTTSTTAGTYTLTFTGTFSSGTASLTESVGVTLKVS